MSSGPELIDSAGQVTVVLDIAAPWVVLAYTAGFISSLVFVSLWPVAAEGPDNRADAAYERILRLFRRRRLAQVVYIGVLMVGVTSLVMGGTQSLL